ncbi:MAG: oligopeptide transporter, OPT family [Deltaproteobacteria bacterium]|nr:oligopeptide transporter, OPT family [Deltaproteobacteria bacterium]MCZ6546686.1 oligopeptide transporter, OPT family [Deltaproteobacteria bacterium]MCZ6620400.1 oligopeptide transporter, OPT family [Deltaproteobacteria bacterium]
MKLQTGKSEITLKAVVLGVLLAIVFGAANAYLGLKVGMTVSASIPAAVMSMAILRGLFRSGTILENNIVQTIASAGESLAAGVIFVVPALIFLGLPPSQFMIFLLAVTGGLLGVLLMVPIRRHLIEEEHDHLPYPEGTACAEVLRAGEEGGKKAKTVFLGLLAGGVFKFLMAGLKVWPERAGLLIRPLSTFLSFDLSPALTGVGYILGIRISSLVFAGGLLGWFVLIPLISYFRDIPVLSADDALALWSNYVRYIGAGAVLGGGLASLARTLPAFRGALRVAMEGLKRQGGSIEDLPMTWVFGGIAGLFLLLFLVPTFHLSFLGALLAIVFAFLFVTVAAWIVGVIGSSQSPVSAMTIATLLIVSVIFVAIGHSGQAGMVSALSLGAIVCIAAAISGDTSQDLKTGFLVGALPRDQQVAEIVGVLASATIVGWVLFLLDKAYTLGSEALSAPQATLMSLVVKGVFGGTMPWVLILTGVFLAVFLELLRVPSISVAIGLYLPLELTSSIFLGGVTARLLGQREKGILYTSGLIAGDALIGILIALLIVSGVPLRSESLFGVPAAFLAFAFLLGILGWGVFERERTS